MVFLALPAGKKSSALCQGKGMLSAVMILGFLMAQAFLQLSSPRLNSYP